MIPEIRGDTHGHTDGAASILNIAEYLFETSNLNLLFESAEHWKKFLLDPATNIWEKFPTVTATLQNPDAIYAAAYAYGALRAEQGYEYMEAKFAPQYHIQQGMNMRQVTRSFYRGFRQAQEDLGIKIVPVICINREADVNTGKEIAKIGVDYGGELILDLACDEANHPPEKHLDAYRLTFGTNTRRDCHAGEWVTLAPAETYRKRLLQNIKTAISELRCHSIGHAIPLPDDPELVKYIADNQIRIAMCPMSNQRLGHIKDIRELRIDYLLEQNVWLTLNSDDDLFLPDMEHTLYMCNAAYDFTEQQCRKLEINSIRHLSA